MRKQNGFASFSKMWIKGAALMVSMFLIQALCLLPRCEARTEAGNENGQKQAYADYARLAGTWMRPDGGYVLELKEVRSNGGLKARYYNPKQINVAKAEWRRTGDLLQVFIELRDVNYPGSTYTLVYSQETDRLEGYYYQALQGQTFSIGFIRIK
jgi:hypothetical protein